MDVEPTEAGLAEIVELVDDVDVALGIAVPALDDTDRQVALAAYRSLASDGAVSTATVAAAAGVDRRLVEDRLAEWPGVFRDGVGRLVGFWGLATAPMTHRLRVGNAVRWTWCAWDPLFIARIVGDATVATVDPMTGEAISYRVARDGSVADVTHPDGLLSFLRPTAPWDGDVITTFCHFVHHFGSAVSAEQWVADHPGTFTLSLPAARLLARRYVDRLFGGLP